MKKFFAKVKDWFIAHKPTKRRLIQVYAALLTNANLTGFATGKIYTGNTKKVCVPGLNCYSCPGAVGACPLGGLQDSLANSGTSAPAYLLGILILFGLLLGRVICGFLCPFGLFQELLYKIRTPKLRKSRFTRVLSYLKYVLLAIMIAVPLIYAGTPAFCKYVCPAGTLGGAVSLLANPNNTSFFGMLGGLFTWKFCVAVAVVVASIFIYRFFCRFICPLGAIYSLFCTVSLLGVKLDKDKCIDCGLCIQNCKMDIRHVGDHECIQCGECIPVCPVQAISWKGSGIFLRNTAPVAQAVAADGDVPLQVGAEAAPPPEESGGVEAQAEKSADLSAEPPAIVEAAVSEGGGDEVTADTAIPEKPAKSGGKLQAVKAAFKQPRFVVEFVAWVLAIALLIGAWIGYGVNSAKPSIVYGVGDRCPLVTLDKTLSETDEQISIVECRGKVTVLNFWYTFCDPCKDELPHFEKVYEDYDGEINMLIVHDTSADKYEVSDFLNNAKDKNGRQWSTYQLTWVQDSREIDLCGKLGCNNSFPLTAVVDVNGYITFVQHGKCSEAELRAAIEDAKNN